MRIICYGDSNTYGYDPRSYFGGRYSAEFRWTDILGSRTGWEIVNAGENGREIPGREQEADQIKQLLQREPADLLIVMLGTNDLLQGADADTASARMERFLQRLEIEKRRLLLLAPPPLQRGEWVSDKELIMQSEKLAVQYEALAGRLAISFADAGKWSIPLTFDGVHFTEEGHQAFSEGLFQTLNERKGE